MSAARVFWPDLEQAEVDDGWQPLFVEPEHQMTSVQVLDALARRYPDDRWNGMPGRWLFLREVQEATGSYGDVQRFDALAVGLVPSVHYARVVFEVKVSRGDWLRELRPRMHRWYHEPLPGNKWDAALRLATEFWFVAPPRCILPTEVPEGCGFMEIRPWGPDRELRARVVVKAPKHDAPNPGPEFWSAVIRRAAHKDIPA